MRRTHNTCFKIFTIFFLSFFRVCDINPLWNFHSYTIWSNCCYLLLLFSYNFLKGISKFYWEWGTIHATKKEYFWWVRVNFGWWWVDGGRFWDLNLDKMPFTSIQLYKTIFFSFPAKKSITRATVDNNSNSWPSNELGSMITAVLAKKNYGYAAKNKLIFDFARASVRKKCGNCLTFKYVCATI